MAKLRVENVRVEYLARSRENVLALDGIDLDVDEGEFVSIVGPSGCGKTTLLNAINGALSVTDGSIELNGKPITGYGVDRAMVFQTPSLLPWRTVRRNIGYGLELQGKRRDPAGAARIAHLIQVTGLQGFENSYPAELSGGMQQRVNLARALAVDPELLLLDEPFAALDAQTREFMQAELLRVWHESRKTAVFITHQIDEAIYLSDRVVVMSQRPGTILEIVRIDLPRPRDLDIKRDPAFVAYYDAIWKLLRVTSDKDHS